VQHEHGRAARLACVRHTAARRPAGGAAPVPAAAQARRFCAEHSIAVTGFSPLGAGSYVSLNMATEEQSALADPTVVRLAAAKGVSPARFVLQWAVQRGISVLPKSTHTDRLRENLDVGEFELSSDEMDAMAALDKNMRFNDPGVFCLGMGAFCPIYD